MYEYKMPVEQLDSNFRLHVNLFMNALLTPQFVEYKIVMEKRYLLNLNGQRKMQHVTSSYSQICRSTLPILSKQRNKLIDMLCNRFLFRLMEAQRKVLAQLRIAFNDPAGVHITRIYILVSNNKSFKYFLKKF